MVILVVALAQLYQGLKESFKFQYISPKLSRKVKGNAGWLEVRFRQPSPGNVPVNGDFAAREHLRHHFKTPYPYSRYYVRNFWDPKIEAGELKSVKYLPDISKMTPEQESVFLGFVKGDDLANQVRRDKYLKYARNLMSQNNPKEWSEEGQKRVQGDIRAIFKPLLKDIEEKEELDGWGDTGDFTGASPYYENPETFLHDYGLVHMTSYELQLYLELEHSIEAHRDEIEIEGEPVTQGNSENWKILDRSHRVDQQQEVVKSLKQRNIKNIS